MDAPGRRYRTDVRNGVAVGVAARQVGVATATLRAWERRYGLRPSGHSPGGHRRYTAADVAALERVRHLVESGMATRSAASLAWTGPSEQGALRTATGSDAYDRWTVAVETLASAEIARVARAVVRQQGIVGAWVEVFSPHLRALGRHWSTTGEGTEREHLTVAVLQSVLRRHAQRCRPRSDRPMILLAATPGEPHTLPLDALAAALADADVSTCVVYDLPALALHTARAVTDPRGIVLWSRNRRTADRPLLDSLIGTVPFLYAAGPGWQPEQLPAGIVHVSSLPTAVESLR